MLLFYAVNPHYINKVDGQTDLYRTNYNQWVNIESSIEEFIEVVTKDGFAINAQINPNTGRVREEDFLKTNLILLDVDDSMTLADAINTPLYKQYGAGYYTTQNHSDEHNKFRLIFVLDDILDDADYVRLVRNSLNWLFKADKVTANPTRVMFGNNTDNKDYEYHNKILPLIELDAVILEYAETEEIVTPTSQPIIYTPTDGMLLPTKVDEINYVLGQLGELSYMEWRNTTWRAIEFLGIEGLNIMKSYYPEQDKNEYKALFTSWSNAKTPHWNGIYKAHNINWYEAQDYVLEQSNKRQKELK